VKANRNVTNVTFDEIRIGASEESTVTLNRTQVDLMALVSGDVDAFHLTGKTGTGEPEPAGKTEAAGSEALLSNIIGTRLPGPGTKILSRDMKYVGNIRVGDSLTARVTVLSKKKAGRLVVLDCRVVNQEGREVVSGTTTVEAPRESLSYDDIAPVHLELRRRDVFMDIFRTCDTCAPVTCAVVHPCDRDSLEGAIIAASRDIIIPILVGPEDKIRRTADEARIDLEDYRIVAVPHSHAAAAKAVELARTGEVESIMKGSLHTDELMGAIVPSAAGMRTARRISHAFVMDIPAYPKMLMMTDAAINIFPSLEVKRDIIQNAIDLARVLGIASPKVGILSAVETVTSKIPSTLDAAALCKMADRGQIRDGILDGPLAFDNAISAQAAKTKGINSPVSGEADILLAPDLESANMLLKQLTYLAGAEGAGIVLGARIPITLTSRADSVRTRLASAAVMAIVAQAARSGQYQVK
jgi:phosphotransacetylase/acyl dehydratase